jgi:CRISPR-associated protein Csx16
MVYLVTRHSGAKKWIEKNGISIDKHLLHLDTSIICKGDIVVGTLPVHLAANVCEKEAQYVHLCLDIPKELRGVELTIEMMENINISLGRYDIKKV